MEESNVLYIILGLLVLIIIVSPFKPTAFRKLSQPPILLPVVFKEEWRTILTKYFSFYNLLPKASKVIFEKRLAHFIRSKKFVPRNLPAITNEIKVFIAASAIQLTFGLPKIYLTHFQYILIYPDDYYSTITHKYHKGEVNPRQHAIVLSLKSYLEGYVSEEGINLGLHEMAHAFHLENRIRNEEFGFLPEDELLIWDKLAEKEIEKINSGNSSFFRKYGGTNSFEFFAVAVENFFELPKEFNSYNRALYESLSNLLNQNPLLLKA